MDELQRLEELQRLNYKPISPELRARADKAYSTPTRRAATLTDWFATGANKQQAIERLLEKRPYIGQTLNDSGKFDIPQNVRTFAGVSDDDVAKALAIQDQKNRNSSQLGQLARKLGVDFNASTTQASFENKIESARNIKKLTQEINNLGPEGAIAIAKLKENGALNTDALLNAKVAVKKEIANADPNVILQRDAAKQSIDASKAAMAGADRDRNFQQNQQTFNQRMSDRTQTFQENQLSWQQSQAAEQAKNRWNDKREVRLQNAETRRINSENNLMQMQLEYARLAQSDRQRTADRRDQALMALLGGLGNLGAAFTV